MAKNVLISGGTGLVGKAIASLLEEKGYRVAFLSRNLSSEDHRFYYWDIVAGTLDPKAIEFADIIIHLAGENISAKSWSKDQKRKIIESRVKSTELLFEKMKASSKKPSLFISASAVGYYGIEPSTEEAREEDKPGDDFLAKTVQMWENAVLKIEELAIPTIRLRFGVVISEQGGFLSSIVWPVKLGIGSPVGSGDQYIPWIELSDLAALIHFVLTLDKPKKVYNAVAPEHISNRELMRTLAKKMNKPFFFPAIPSFMIRLLFGEMGDIILFGKKVSSDRISSEGFSFKYKSFEEAISNYKL
jgi:uncharacterized protein (TIGR01777 family)